ncbi:TonB-dependent receptor [Neiella sp. HB171785]|uniref:TonB-dependent receptor n=2 Tax=Neiella litorisoli TaxID=2771431 RepID=A0A8J6QHM5_9GAMM|nr:TonB-dependent receptor [Neiella litorisoli]
MVIGGLAHAAEPNGENNQNEDVEVIEVSGIRGALITALSEKRENANITEIINAEDIGKLPDNNLAEVLENVTGVQIDRTNGVGTGVQIRGTGANRVEINGVSTVSAGSDRTGIRFEDLPAALIASLEVTKSSTAKTIEGSVGGTVNLRTLRGNSLKDRLIQFRIQAEHSDLADSTQPKISGTYGDNWETSIGKLGFVATASYAKQDVASANPRFDRDRAVMSDSGLASAEEFNFLRTQFLDQPLSGKEYKTKNLTTSLELQATEHLNLYFDATLNDQDATDDNSRAFFSGTGGTPVINNTTNTGFETIDLGKIDGVTGKIDLGEVTVVTSGILGVGVSGDGKTIDPNLRTGNSNSARETDSSVFAFGGEYSTEDYTLAAEVSYSDSETNSPSFNTTLDFINPNGPQVTADTRNDNGTPAEFKIKNDTFQFGIAQGLPETPSSAELLDPANYALRSTGQGKAHAEGKETAARVDFSYDISDTNPWFVDVLAGVRWNKTTNEQGSERSSFSFGNWNRPRANLFADIVKPGANNFNKGDSRDLYIKDYLIVSNGISRNNPDYVFETFNNAIIANNALNDPDFSMDAYNELQAQYADDPSGFKSAAEARGWNTLLTEPTVNETSFFDIEEKTWALYLQANLDFEAGTVPITGNIGARYIETDLDSYGNQVSTINGTELVTPSKESSSYSYVLPRFNIAAELSEGLYMKAGIGKDIRRPDFDWLSTSTSFGASASAAVTVGNPDLEPEEIWSYDLSLEYYFAPSAFMSIGFFHKERTNLIVLQEESPDEPIGAGGQIERDVEAPCENGGIFNPNVPPENYNVFSSREDTFGICVAKKSRFNASGTETQSGVEVAAQYDFSEFEDQLGWASGFGIIANYTYQDSGEGLDDYYYATGLAGKQPGDSVNPNAIDQILGRDDYFHQTETTADDPVTKRVTLHKLSKHSYNFTLFYEKYDISARMRYTYRSEFTEELNRMRFNIPVIVGSRGQLNASVNYQLNENFTVGIEGVNLTKEDRTRWCFNEDTLLCEQSLTDRRITASLAGKF